MASLAQVLSLADCSRNDFNYLKRSGLLRTAYAPTTVGVAAELSLENALEIALVASLVKGGATASRAVVFAEPIVKQAKARPERVREWLVFAGGDPATAIASDDPDLPGLHNKLGSNTLSIVRVGEIVRRVHQLFEAEEV